MPFQVDGETIPCKVPDVQLACRGPRTCPATRSAAWSGFPTMTQQSDEALIYRGRSYALRDLPLDDCTDPSVRDRLEGLRRGEGVQVMCSALWRGYCGTWEIKSGRLWLVTMESARSLVYATPPADMPPADPDSFEGCGLAWLFPGTRGPVLADWFTGMLKSPRGRAQRTGQSGYGTPYTRVFHVEAGVIVGTELQDNRAALRKAAKRPTAAEAVARLSRPGGEVWTPSVRSDEDGFPEFENWPG